MLAMAWKTSILDISLLLLKIFAWNLEHMLTIGIATYTIKGDNCQYIFFARIMPIVLLIFFTIQHLPKQYSLRILLGDNNYWNSITLSQMSNFRLLQTERVCRQQFQIWWKWQKVLQKGREHCRKRRNYSLRAISPFPAVFSKDLYCRQVKTRACLGKGYCKG